MPDSFPAKLQSRTIKRTLCIGLGGTGRDVLMQVRKLIIDRYGKLSNLPIVSFLHIDADKGAGETAGLKTGNTYRGEEILFREAERVVASMSSQEINQLTQGLERRESHEQSSPYNHIGCWFSPHLLKNIKAIEDGASGIRPVGRLSFFHNYRKIQAGIQSAESRTRGHDSYLIKKGLVVEPGFNIFVVGSLCGGTGSGMFLDVAYGLRQAYGEVENQLIGYWVVSPDLYGNTPSMNANVYAALKELNHYAASNTCFQACYDPQHLTNIDERRPPFDYVYLVSNQTATDYKILDKSKLCNVIAHKIFLDFGDELTSIVQGQKNNFLEKLARTDEHPRRNVQRYLTFGFAKLYFPYERTVKITLNQIRKNLVSYWLDGKGQSPDSQDLLDRFLLTWETNRDSTIPIIVKQLEMLAQIKNKTFSQELKVWSGQIEESINTLQKSSDRQRLTDQFPGDIRAQFRKVQPGENDSTRGAWLTCIRQTTPKLVQKLKQSIEQYLAELLQPASADFSLRTARSWLEALLSHLNQCRSELETSLQSLDSLNSTDDLEKKWRSTAQRLQDIEQQRSCFGLKDKQKNQQYQEEARQSLRNLNKLMRHNVDYALYQEVLHLVKELQQFTHVLINRGTQFNSLLKEISKFYEKQSEDLLQLDLNEITGEALFVEEDSEECYRQLLPESEYNATLVEISKQILAEISDTDSFAQILVQGQSVEDQQLQGNIDTAVDKQFSSASSAIKQSVIKRFLQKYSLSDAQKRINQILREAKPLLPLNLSDPYFYNDQGKHSEIIAFKQNDDRFVQQFRDLLIRDLGVLEPVLKPIQSDDEILILNEYAAFPLRLIQGLERMREQYNRQCQMDLSLFHNDCNQVFSEIIPPEARRMEELQDVFYACIAFGILQEQDQSYVYKYFDEFFGRNQQIVFSPVWTEALEQLASSDIISQDLQRKRDEIFDNIRRTPSNWQQEYLPKLLEFSRRVEALPQHDPNYLEKVTVLGENATFNKPGTIGVLRRLNNYLIDVVEQSQNSLQSGQRLLRDSNVETGPEDSEKHTNAY